MTDDRYRAAFESAKQDCQQAESRITELQRELDKETERLGHFQRVFNALAEMYGQPVVNEPFGLTDAIRHVFQDAGEPLTASEVRGRLELSSSRFNLRTQRNPDASIATVIKRLEESRFVTRKTKTAYSGGRTMKRFAWVRRNQESDSME